MRAGTAGAQVRALSPGRAEPSSLQSGSRLQESLKRQISAPEDFPRWKLCTARCLFSQGERFLHLLRGAGGSGLSPVCVAKGRALVWTEDSEARPSGTHHPLLRSLSPLTFAFKHVVVTFKYQENM